MHAIAFKLPQYSDFSDQISILGLSISSSALHGMMCGYLCAGATQIGDSYIRGLVINKTGSQSRSAIQALFNLYTISQQQMDEDTFIFELMLPEDEKSLAERALAFSEWCAGFIHSLQLSGVDSSQLDEEDSQDALQHLEEFAKLDYAYIDVTEEDEKALVDVSEYARMAVLRLYWDLKSHVKSGRQNAESMKH